MKLSTLIRAACFAAAAACTGLALATDIKIGIVAPFSGPFAYYGTQTKAAVEGFIGNQGGTLAGKTVEIVYRDTGGPNPAATKAMVQELIVKEKVDYLGGFVFTPNAIAAASLIQEAKVPTVIFVAAGSVITKKSDYFIRTGHTSWQVTTPLANAIYKQGIRKMITAVVDYAPGVDAEEAFKAEFTRAGGTVTASIRMPLKTTDFTPFAQRIKASGAQGVFVFLAGGPPNISFVKAYAENGLKAAGIEFFGTTETDEYLLQQFGDAALGLTTAYHYSAAHESAANRAFVAAVRKADKAAIVNSASVGAWDGMYVIQKMIAATGGRKDGNKALTVAKTLAWESPRGPVGIDPRTRHITQSVYLRKVEKLGGQLVNREIADFGRQVDTGFDK